MNFPDVIVDLTWKRDHLLAAGKSVETMDQYNKAIDLLQKAADPIEFALNPLLAKMFDQVTDLIKKTKEKYKYADPEMAESFYKAIVSDAEILEGIAKMDKNRSPFPPKLDTIAVEEFNMNSKTMYAIGVPGYNEDEMQWDVRLAMKSKKLPVHYTVHGATEQECLYRAQRLAMIMTTEIKKS